MTNPASAYPPQPFLRPFHRVSLTVALLLFNSVGIEQLGEGTHITTHFYKALYTPAQGWQAIAFVFENDDAAGPLSAGAVSVRELEELTELDFFPDMPVDRQDLIESAGPNLGLWRADYPGNFRCDADHLAGTGNRHCDQEALRILNGCGQGNLPQVTLPACV